LARNLQNVEICDSIYLRSRVLPRHGQRNCIFTRVYARKANGTYSTVAAEYEKPPADRRDVAKANKVPTKQRDYTETRHLTMYYSNRFITGTPMCQGPIISTIITRLDSQLRSRGPWILII